MLLLMRFNLMPLVILNDNIQNTRQKRGVNIRYLKQINILSSMIYQITYLKFLNNKLKSYIFYREKFLK